MNGSVLSRPVAVAGIHGQLEAEVTADLSERTALAAAYDLLDVTGLSATATISADANGIDVSGRVTADIAQACVVSLVPVEQHIDEPFFVRFVRPGSPELPPAGRPHEEVVVDPGAPDPPEVLTGPFLDLGPVVEEAFVLAIEPYPRAPGAVLADEAVDQNDSADSPFAVLGALKPK
jgi:uncharacterized metal-binding protein YceD (DUF177 family)